MSDANMALAEVRSWLCDNLSSSDAGKACGMLSVVSRRITELESENTNLRKFAEMFAKVANEVGCDHCPYCEPDLCDEEIDPMKDGCRLYDELRELGIEVAE